MALDFMEVGIFLAVAATALAMVKLRASAHGSPAAAADRASGEGRA